MNTTPTPAELPDEILTSWETPRWADSSQTSDETIIHAYTPPSAADLSAVGTFAEVEPVSVALQVTDQLELVPGRGVRVLRSAPQILIADYMFTIEQAGALATAINEAIEAMTASEVRP